MAESDQFAGRVLLTGATSGIGRVAAEEFATRGWAVHAVGRDRGAGKGLENLGKILDGEIRFHRVDLSEFAMVRALANELSRSYDQLDVLVNNAGLSSGDWNKSPDGIEMTMAVNHLAPYLLTHGLIDLLIESDGRIVTTASEFHRRGSLDEDDLWFEDSFDTLNAYARSKLANIAFTVELAERLPEGTVANCFHPGFIPATRLFRAAQWYIKIPLRLAAAIPFVGTSKAEGARRLIELATASTYGQQSGIYLGGDGPATPDRHATDQATRERLWEASAEVLDIDPDWP